MNNLKAFTKFYRRCKEHIAASLLMSCFFVSSAAFAAKDKKTEGLPQLDVSTYASQIFWLFIFFFLLHLIFSKAILPAIYATIQKRNLHIEDDRETASRLVKEAEEAQNAYEEKLQQAKIEASQIHKDIERDMAEDMQKRWEDFRHKAREEEARVVSDIAKAKEDVMEDMNVIAAEIAKEATEKIVGVDMDLDAAKNAVNALSKKVKAA